MPTDEQAGKSPSPEAREHKIVKAPWTAEQVHCLLDWQVRQYFHPFTCGTSGCRADLLPTSRGWICPMCDYTQDWAHDFMAMPLSPEQREFYDYLHNRTLIERYAGERERAALERAAKRADQFISADGRGQKIAQAIRALLGGE